MVDKERIISIIRSKGPVLPVDVAKELKTSIIMASAMLSELVSNKSVKLTYAKYGGTPMYYIVGQEPKLVLLRDKLHEKEKRAYDLLKETRILRDSELKPVERVAMREIRDFAKPLEVTLNGQKEIFWRWFMTSGEEAANTIRSRLSPLKTKKPENIKQEEVRSEVEPVKYKEEKKVIIAQKREKPIREEEKPDSFEEKIRSYCVDNKIRVINSKIIKKNSEVEMVVIVPSAAGDLTFYCRAKKKKRCNDADLSASFIQGQIKKLPVLFITTGDFTKKAKEMLQSEFRGIKTKKI